MFIFVKLHEIILNFWLYRLIDDPTLEINDEILENELNELIKNETIRNEIENHWNSNNNKTMKRIQFESKLQFVMIQIIDKKYLINDNNKQQLKSKKYIKLIWDQYNKLFLDDMDCSEQIEIYFDHHLKIHQHVDELQDFHEPPLRLHKFVQLCQHRNQCNNNNNNSNLYHLFVACS